MTLGDLYPDVRLYSDVETIMTREEGRVRWEGGGEGEMGGGSGRTYGKGRRARRWLGDEERGTGLGEIRGVRELSPEVGREGNV